MAGKKESLYPWIALTIGVLGASVFLIRHLDEFRHIRAACIAVQGLPVPRAIEALSAVGAQDFRIELEEKTKQLAASKAGEPKAWAEFFEKAGQVGTGTLYAKSWQGVRTHRSCWGEIREGKFAHATFE